MFATDPFLHYSSPRLLKEGKKDIEQITNHFNRLFLTLIAARNEDSKEMHRKLLAVEEKEKAANHALSASQNAQREAMVQAETSKRQVELQEQELEAQRLELEMYKAQLKLAQHKNKSSS